MNNTQRKPENEGKARNIPIRFPDEMFQKLSAIGKESDRKFSYMVKVAIQKYIEAYEKKNGKKEV